MRHGFCDRCGRETEFQTPQEVICYPCWFGAYKAAHLDDLKRKAAAA